MIIMKRLRLLLEKDKEAAVVNEAILVTATCEHREALAALERASVQAERLTGMDTRNHYSESLTHAFRGRTV